MANFPKCRGNIQLLAQLKKLSQDNVDRRLRDERLNKTNGNKYTLEDERLEHVLIGVLVQIIFLSFHG